MCKNDLEMKKKFPDIYARHTIKGPRCPEGRISHEMSCDLNKPYLRICTCGLHYMLSNIEREYVEQIYPLYYEEKIKGNAIELFMLELHCLAAIGHKLYLKCGECQERRDDDDSYICNSCAENKGKEFILFEPEKPMTDEEFYDLMQKI